MKNILQLSLLASGLFLQGCASVQTMETRDMSTAPSRTFQAGMAQVETATQNSIAHLGYAVEKTEREGKTTHIFFKKPVSAFSWGEVGRVDVMDTGAGTTKVVVGSEKRYQLQVTGTSQGEFADNIFNGIAADLTKNPQE